MKRRQFLTLLAAGASLAVPMKGFSSVLDDSVPLSGEKDCDSTSQAQQLTSTTETALPMPIQILDLHSHMFNCRYLPLESIIYDRLKHRIFAKLVAKILYRITGSSYETPQSRQNLMRKETDPGQDTNPELIDEHYINEIAEMVKYELRLTTHSPEIMQQGLDLSNKMSPMKEAYPSLMNSDLFDLISQLEKVSYKMEWEAAIPTSRLPPLSIKTLNATKSIQEVLNDAGSVAKKALWVFVKLVLPKFWGETVHSYAEAFFTLLSSEEQLFDRFSKAYGDIKPPIQTVHYMMDMQMAYADKIPAFYDFPTVQLDRMQTLWRRHAGILWGFSAFDPRRPKWKDLAIESRDKSFIGFKFYPAMGYRPFNDKNETVRERINAFFLWCVENDLPIFAHCTPEGFQTSKTEGRNAHPKYWRKVLEATETQTLRLCLGHAGGGRMGKSAGWLATSKEEWETEHNYASVVVQLCTTYKNVYCDMAYITALLADDRNENTQKTFLCNLDRARKTKGKYDFMTKIAYGSDWHMPQMVTNASRYLKEWLKIFSLPDYKDYREKFFCENGKAYAKIDNNSFPAPRDPPSK